MSASDFQPVFLTRGDIVIMEQPSVDDVWLFLKAVESEFEVESQQKGEPEFALEYSSKNKYDIEFTSQLQFMIAFHSTNALKWVVDFNIPNSRGTSLLLAIHPSIHGDFETRTCCGVATRFRANCLMEDASTIRSAIAWFLDYHTPNPQLAWMKYFDAVEGDNGIC